MLARIFKNATSKDCDNAIMGLGIGAIVGCAVGIGAAIALIITSKAPGPSSAIIYTTGMGVLAAMTFGGMHVGLYARRIKNVFQKKPQPQL